MELKKEFIERSEELLGSDAAEYFKVLEVPLVDSFRINTLKTTIKGLKNRLTELGWLLRPVPWCKEGYWVNKGPYKLGNTLEHFLGYYYVQEPASMIPPLIMDLKPGLKVLDMAASPGSKTGQIAGLMQDEGLIMANDVRIDRVSILKFNMQRMGLRSIVITRRNAVNFRKMNGFFDRVLLDAPCSGEGVIRKNPYAAKQWNVHHFPRFSKVQKDLIISAYDSLKPNGTLVYSTCSLAPEENEEVIDHLLRNRSARIMTARLKGLKARPGVTEWHGKELDKSIKGSMRIYPQDNDTEGFFACKIIKGEVN